MTIPSVQGQSPKPFALPRKFSDFSAAALTNTITLGTPVAGTVLQSSQIECLTAFTGGSVASCTISLGITGQEDLFASAKSVFTTGSQVSSYVGDYVFDGSTALVAKITTTGANVDALTAGLARLWVLLFNPQGIQGPVTSEVKGNPSGIVGINNLTDGATDYADDNLFISNTAKNTLATNSGSGNTALGSAALALNTTGGDNSAVGVNALGSNTTGFSNTALGSSALSSNDTGQFNTAVGARALFSNVTGSHNTAIGLDTLKNNTASGNTALGEDVLFNVTSGADNTALGYIALLNLSTGANNTAAGKNSGVTATTESGNTLLGKDSDITAGVANTCAIGQGAKSLVSNTAQIGNSSVAAFRVGAAIAVAALPSASAIGSGARAFVTDSNATLAAGIGNTVAAGGANFVPVYSDGTNWKIG